MRILTVIMCVILPSLTACSSNEQLPDALGVEVGPVSGTGNADWACEQDEDGLWTCLARDEKTHGEVQ